MAAGGNGGGGSGNVNDGGQGLRRITHDAVWKFFCAIDVQVIHVVSEQDLMDLLDKEASFVTVTKEQARAMFRRAVQAKVDTKVSKTGLEFRDFKKIFLVRRQYLKADELSNPKDHGAWTYVCDNADFYDWLILLRSVVDEPFEPDYDIQGFSSRHWHPRQEAHFEREAQQRESFRRTMHQQRHNKTKQLTFRVIEDTTAPHDSTTASEKVAFRSAVAQQATDPNQYIFEENLQHVTENNMTRSNFGLQKEFNTTLREETAMRGSNTTKLDYYNEAYEDHDVAVELHQHDHLATQRDIRAAQELIDPALASRGLLPAAAPKANGRKPMFKTLVAPPNNTEASNQIAVYNNPIRGHYKEIDTRTTRQQLWDEQNDPHQLAFATSRAVVERLCAIQNDRRQPYMWKQPTGPNHNFYKNQDLKSSEAFGESERLMNYHNQLFPATGVNPSVDMRRTSQPAQPLPSKPGPPQTDRSHHTSTLRRNKVNSAPASGSRAVPATARTALPDTAARTAVPATERRAVPATAARRAVPATARTAAPDTARTAVPDTARRPIEDRQVPPGSFSRPFGFKIKEMPPGREIGTGEFHCIQTVRDHRVRNVRVEARVHEKMKAEMQKHQTPWVETKMGILRVEEKRKELGDIDHLLVDTQHPLRRTLLQQQHS